MKMYMKPAIMVEDIQLESLLTESLNDVTGADGLSKGDGEFAGGNADSRRRGSWDDED